MRKFIIGCCVVLLGLLSVGCGGGTTERVPITSQVAEQIKQEDAAVADGESAL